MARRLESSQPTALSFGVAQAYSMKIIIEGEATCWRRRVPLSSSSWGRDRRSWALEKSGRNVITGSLNFLARTAEENDHWVRKVGLTSSMYLIITWTCKIFLCQKLPHRPGYYVVFIVAQSSKFLHTLARTSWSGCHLVSVCDNEKSIIT
jgi:hypothetical protein